MPRILIVDDEKIILLLLEKILEKINYKVIGQASSGRGAVNKAKELKPDLILMDISMPGEIDGIEAAKEINKMTEKIPIIFVTAYTKDIYEEKLKNVKFFGYLTKPFDAKQLQKSIEKALIK